MGFFKKILFPVDLSGASFKIVPYVKEMMHRFDSELHVVYVNHVFKYLAGLDVSAAYMGKMESEIKIQIGKKIENFLMENFTDFSVQHQIVDGRPGPAILRYIEAEGIDLVIMGHSSRGIERAVFGSVAGYVVKYSSVPVMIISPSILAAVKQKKKDASTRSAK